MIRHIVCFKLKDNSSEKCEEAKNVLLSMKENVPLLKEIQVGIDFLRSEASFDIILDVLLESREALDLYQNDVYHVDVVKKYIHQVICDRVVIDYEV